MSMISINNLQKKFGRKKVLNNLNLEVDEGEFLVIFGPNGAGKTTLIKILSTLSRPSSGNVIINGFDLNEEPIDIRNSIGVVSHNPFLYDDLSLKENLIFYSKMYGIKNDEKAIKNLVDEVGLLHRLNDRVGEFSRGMKQRASVARVIIHNPPVLLLDEPYTGLDFKAWDILTNILMKFYKDGKTIFLITHNVELGYKIGKRFAILVNGKLAYDCRKEETDLEAFKGKYHGLMGAQR